MQKTAEETALKSSSEIDTRAFMWTFDCLDEDHELESFFSGLPGFRNSKVVKDPLPSLTEEEMEKLYGALRGLLDRTFSSDFLPAPIKNWRAFICAKAVDPKHSPIDWSSREPMLTAFRILDAILYKYQHSGPVVTGIVNILKGWGNNMDEDRVVYAQLTNYKVLASSQPHDSSWYNFASEELGLPETSLRDYATQGNSLSFVILIHVVRQQFTHFGKTSSLHKDNFSYVLAEASEFDEKDTSSELQHEFCALWNQIVNKAQGGGDQDMARLVLKHIRNVYLSLHQNTDSAPTQFSASTGNWDPILRDPSSYPVCKVPDHSSDSAPHIHDNGVSATLARSIPHDLNDSESVPSLTSLDPPSSSTHAPFPMDRTLTDTLLLHNPIPVPVSTQVIGQMIAEGRRISAISLSPVIETSRTTRSSTSSPSPKSNASDFPPADIAVGQSTFNCAPSDDLKFRLSSSPTPILDTIIPTGLFSFQAVTRSDLLFVYFSNRR